MQTTQIIYHDMEHTPVLSRSIREKCESLDRLHPDIGHCRVSVRRVPALARARAVAVAVRVGLPDGELVAGEVLQLDAHLAVREAFAEMRRQLQAHAEATRVAR